MTRAFDVRHVTAEDILTTVDLQVARQLAARDAGQCPNLVWFSEADMQGRNLWRLPEVCR